MPISGIVPQSTYISRSNGGVGTRRFVQIYTTDTQAVVEAANYIRSGEIPAGMREGIDLLEFVGPTFTQRYTFTVDPANNALILTATGGAGTGSVVSDGVISNVALAGTNLNFTGTGGAFSGSVDLAALPTVTTNLSDQADGTLTYVNEIGTTQVFNAFNEVTAAGQLLVGSAPNDVSPLSIGTAGQVLTVDPGGTTPVWTTLASSSETLPVTIFDAAGDLIVGTANDVASRLPVGAAGEVLTVSALGLPVWAAPAGGTTETTTTLVDNGNRTFTYTNEAGAAVTYSSADVVTTLVDNTNGTITYTSEDGTATTFEDNRVNNSLTAASVGTAAADGDLWGFDPATGATFYANASGNWTATPSAAINSYVFISNSVMNPAAPGAPTTAEAIAAGATVADTFYVYNGTNTDSSDPTYVWYVDGSGTTKRIDSASAGGNNLFTADLTLAANRTHDLSTNTFTFNMGAGAQFDINTPSGSGGVAIDANGVAIRNDANDVGVDITAFGVNLLFTAGRDLSINGQSGTTGQTIISQGDGAPPIWGTIGGGLSTVFVTETVMSPAVANEPTAGDFSTAVPSPAPSTLYIYNGTDSTGAEVSHAWVSDVSSNVSRVQQPNILLQSSVGVAAYGMIIRDDITGFLYRVISLGVGQNLSSNTMSFLVTTNKVEFIGQNGVNPIVANGFYPAGSMFLSTWNGSGPVGMFRAKTGITAGATPTGGPGIEWVSNVDDGGPRDYTVGYPWSTNEPVLYNGAVYRFSSATAATSTGSFVSNIGEFTFAHRGVDVVATVSALPNPSSCVRGDLFLVPNVGLFAADGSGTINASAATTIQQV